MPGAPQINWDEYLETYNRIHKASFKTPQDMIAALYAREGTLIKVSEIMGVSVDTIHLFMKKWGIPRLPKGHRGNSSFQVAFQALDVETMTHWQIADAIGCCIGYIPRLMKKYNKKSVNAFDV